MIVIKAQVPSGGRYSVFQKEPDPALFKALSQAPDQAEKLLESVPWQLVSSGFSRPKAYARRREILDRMLSLHPELPRSVHWLLVKVDLSHV